ncbi:DUF3581 family protein [Marinobacter sp.]|uniref:DUF3581 family protein n=1 Tax=Marinobacter sp. TaxID=50741 RepID=UPI003A8E6696
MFLDRFHTVEDGHVVISALQGSQFAKEIAGDFNPIHDPDARRFCVPGDLLFAIILARFGLSEHMTFRFRSLLGAGVPLRFVEAESTIDVCDDAGKVYIEVIRSGARTQDRQLIEEIIRAYVSASGKNFPHTLKPLMESNGVMFNPDRPMVMYESMSLALDNLDLPSPGLEMHNATLDAAGKRGNVLLEYRLTADGKAVGEVTKRLVLSGLRPYSPEAMAGVIEEFYRLKARGVNYFNNDNSGDQSNANSAG